MAFTASSSEMRISGRRYLVVTVTETNADAAQEWSFEFPSALWTLMSFHATLTAGSGATINPILGRAAGFAADSQDHIATQSSTAADINDQTEIVCNLTAAAPTLYGRSTVNAGADNAITSVLVFAEGAV